MVHTAIATHSSDGTAQHFKPEISTLLHPAAWHMQDIADVHTHTHTQHTRRKKTHTDRYLDFESHHPLAHKVAVARTLLTRADRICTDFPDKARVKERVTQALRVNGYPRELVTKNWKPTARPHQPEVSDTPKAKVILPYDLRECPTVGSSRTRHK